MMTRLGLPFLLVASLISCKPSSAPPSASPVSSGPHFSVSAADTQLTDEIGLVRFTLEGQGVDEFTATLWQIEKGEARSATRRTFSGIDGALKGELWVLTEEGTKFGKKDAISVSLGSSVDRAKSSLTDSGNLMLTGPFKHVGQQFFGQGKLVQGIETILLERNLGREADGESGASSLETLKGRSRSLNGTILALTILWPKK